MPSKVQEKKYTEDHEWIELDADHKIGMLRVILLRLGHILPANPTPLPVGTMGISYFASNALGDVVFVELPEPNRHINKGDAIGAVESVKSASDIMTPVSGTIVEANAALEESPGTINKGPEAEGWLAKIEVEDLAELDGLMSAEEYERFTKEE